MVISPSDRKNSVTNPYMNEQDAKYNIIEPTALAKDMALRTLNSTNGSI
jgi:hypothetical protein